MAAFERAYVVLLNQSDAISDVTVAQMLFDTLADEGFDIISINPHGGDAPTISVDGPQGSPQTFQ